MVSPRELSGKVAIVGAYDTAVGVVANRTPMELCVEAALGALADAGLDRAQADGLVTCNSMAQPLLYHAEALAEYLQVFPRYCMAVGAGGGTTFSVLHHAASAIATGMADVVLVVMADSLRSTTVTARSSCNVMGAAKEPLTLEGGATRSFVEDGDRLTLHGHAQGSGYRIGFGDCTGRILPAALFP